MGRTQSTQHLQSECEFVPVKNSQAVPSLPVRQPQACARVLAWTYDHTILLNKAWVPTDPCPSSPSPKFPLPKPCRAFESWMSWGTNPLYVLLHESIYCQGAASNWAAHRVREQHYAAEFDAVAAARAGEGRGGALRGPGG